MFCDAYQVVTALVAIGAPVSHYAIGKLGALLLTVGLDTCYALNTIGSVWVVLPAHTVWLHRKASDMGTAADDPDGEDLYAAGVLATLWANLARTGLNTTAASVTSSRAASSWLAVDFLPVASAAGAFLPFASAAGTRCSFPEDRR